MEAITFTFRGKEFRGNILSSTFQEPVFYWLLFDDAELLRITGGEDSVCFQQIKGELVCTSLVLQLKCPDLVMIAKAVIEAHTRI